ncbi:MAG: hypothetical protein GQ476_05350 [Candidatus Aminicenantes bacterium]|jgi:hypothetical protein|nr:hypothetical protein [Candidatus Aminicenantes bacterium]
MKDRSDSRIHSPHSSRLLAWHDGQNPRTLHEKVNNISLPQTGQQYYKSMSEAVNYAFANRQMIAHWVRNVFAKVMGSSGGMDQVYDVCHNVAKVENHRIDGSK